MDIKTIYEDDNILVIDKPAGIITFPEIKTTGETVIDCLTDQKPELKQVGLKPRYGVVHRLDKDTSGVLLIAKTSESLIFLQKQFKNRGVTKKYIALAVGTVKNDQEEINTLIGRSPQDPRKQKAYPLDESSKKGLRQAITAYHVLKRFQHYTLLEIQIKTGRRHQIRCHLAHIHHPIAGDKLYDFKDSPCPSGLKRQFLHAYYLKTMLPNGQEKEFSSNLPDDLNSILANL